MLGRQQPDVGAIGAVQGVYEDEKFHSEQQLRQPLLTADDIAAWLAVPRSSVFEYARREHEPLPAVRIGRHLRFVRDDVAVWIEAARERRRCAGAAGAGRAALNHDVVVGAPAEVGGPSKGVPPADDAARLPLLGAIRGASERRSLLQDPG